MTDLDHLLEVMEASFDPHYREAWTRRQVEDSLSLSSTYMILVDTAGAVLREGDVAAGFVLARQAADEVELLLIAVVPGRRGLGLGRKLLHLFFDSARARSATRVFLEMRANNPAGALYRSEGFEQIGRRRDYYRTITGERIDALTFARAV